MLEEEVALQAQELARQLALAVTHDLGDRDRGVVVVAQSGDAAEELERCDVALLEGLGALAGVGRDEEGVRVGKRHDRECGLSALARDLDGRLAEVELGAPRRVAEGHEDLGGVASLEGHVAADLGLAAPVVVLVSEALEDPLRGVALLAWRRRVGVGPGSRRSRRGRARAWACHDPRASGSRGAQGARGSSRGSASPPCSPGRSLAWGPSRRAPCAGSLSTVPCLCAPFSRLLAWPIRGSLGGGRQADGDVRCCRFRCALAPQGCCRFRCAFTPIDLGVRWEPNASDPVLVQTRRRAMLVAPPHFDDEDRRQVVLRIRGCEGAGSGRLTRRRLEATASGTGV